MRITYQGSGRFEVDGEVLEPGESAEVSDERGTECAERFPGILVIASTGFEGPAQKPDDPLAGAPSSTSPVTPLIPSAQSASGTAPSDSTAGASSS